MKIQVLGYYGGYPYAGHGTSSYLISEGDFHLLLDCGSGALMALEKVFDPLKLDAVIISHYHADHQADIGVLQYYYQLKTGDKKKSPLPIYGHKKDFEHFKALTFGQITQGIAYDPTKKLNLGPLVISFCQTIHPVVAYAMRIESQIDGKVLSYTADTRYFSDLTNFIKNSDLLIADTNFSADKVGELWHMTSTQSAKLGLEGHVKSLLLSHLPQEVDHQQILKEAQSKAPQLSILLAQQNLELTV